MEHIGPIPPYDADAVRGTSSEPNVTPPNPEIMKRLEIMETIINGLILNEKDPNKVRHLKNALHELSSISSSDKNVLPHLEKIEYDLSKRGFNIHNPNTIIIAIEGLISGVEISLAQRNLLAALVKKLEHKQITPEEAINQIYKIFHPYP